MPNYKHLVALLSGGALLFGLASCGSNDSSNNSPAVAKRAASTTNTVTIPTGAATLGDAGYGTNPLTIPAGTSIVWTNSDTVPHSATSTTGVWDTGSIAAGASSAAVVFNTPGTYPYDSTVSGDDMSGEIIVTAAASPSPSPSASPVWNQVMETVACTSTTGYCPGEAGFTVTDTGAYTDAQNGGTGNVTAAQLANLNTAANAAAAGEGTYTQVCSTLANPSTTESNVTVELTYADGSVATIYSYSATTGQVCYLASSQAVATSLWQAIDPITQQYDSSATPSPSPSASVSPSPTVSPSVSPSPTVSPTTTPTTVPTVEPTPKY